MGTPRLDEARSALTAIAGDAAMAEAAATIAIFSGLVRVADGTGIQLDGGLFAYSAADRARLGIDKYAGAANTDVERASRPPTDGSFGSMFG